VPARILIFTSSHLCRNPRVVKEATALGSAGYDVTVLTVSSLWQFEQMDRALIARLPFRRVALDYTAQTPGTRLENLVQRAATWGARRMLHWLRIENAQALGPAHALLRRALAMPADLIIAHTEIPLWASAALIRAGRAVAVDIEDWYSEDLLFSDRRTRPLKLLRRAETFALQHARYVSPLHKAWRRRWPQPATLRCRWSCGMSSPCNHTRGLTARPAAGRRRSSGPRRRLALDAAWSYFLPRGAV
jgi:hypothetical protein